MNNSYVHAENIQGEYDISVKGDLQTLLLLTSGLIKTLSIRMYEDVDYTKYVNTTDCDTEEEIMDKLQLFILMYLYDNVDAFTTISKDYEYENIPDRELFNITDFENLIKGDT